MLVVRYRCILIVLLILLGFPAGVIAVDPSYSITYTIDVHEDGSAVWHVEYRTLLATEADRTAFDNYSRDLQSVYLPKFQDLMTRSAAQATIATARLIKTSSFSGDAAIQTSPTGTYGVIFYSCTWNGFARPGSDINIGDAFVGGLYLEKDNTLVVRYPESYTVKSVEPLPDQVRSGLIWYGQRSFGAGEPRIILEKQTVPLTWVVPGLGIIILVLAGFGLFLVIRQRKKTNAPEEPVAVLSDGEIRTLEERIIQLLTDNGGELYQSEIVRDLSIPKSTVGVALNHLHEQGTIQKVRKGRENLIRLF